MKHAEEFRNAEKCAACGGICCKTIYLPASRGGYMPDYYWFEQWCEEFHSKAHTYGVEPFFDPVALHIDNDARLRKELARRGIDPFACEYLSEKGCIIPWEKRPSHCKSYRCPSWE